MTDREEREMLRTEALYPPPYLLAMRKVLAGVVPTCNEEQAAYEACKADPARFLRDLMSADKWYREFVASHTSSSKPVMADSDIVEPDRNTEMMKGLLKDEWELLKQFDAAQKARRKHAQSGTDEPFPCRSAIQCRADVEGGSIPK